MGNARTVLLNEAMDASFNSDAINIEKKNGIGIQCVYAGTTIAGTLKIQSSVDLAAGIDENWDDITSETLSASGSSSFNLSNLNAPYVRVSWTDAGTSSADAFMSITTYVKE